MNFLTAIMFGGFGCIYIKNNLANIKKVIHYLSIIPENQGNIMSESLQLKEMMIKFIMIGTAGYCFDNVLLYSVVKLLGDDFVRVKLEVVIQSFDFFWIGLILWACRPRKEWPSFFTH